MSPRRNRRHRTEPASGPDRTRVWRGVETVESGPDGDWTVRAVPGDTGKTYRCPGCDQEIQPGVGHLVAWPADGGVDDRRHWHTACWRARARRGPGVRRGRNAPRYG